MCCARVSCHCARTHVTALRDALQVKLLDRKLGLLYTSIIFLVFSYVVGWRIVKDKEYNAVERPHGILSMQLNGTSYALQDGVVIPADASSLTMLGPEVNALFLPTRVLSWRDQMRGNCSSPDETCSLDADCVREPPLAVGKCESGMCERFQWCNSPEYLTSHPHHPFADAGLSTAEAVLQELERLSIVISASVRFDHLGQVEMSTEDGRPNARVRWTVSQVVQRAGMTVEEAIERGGVLSVVLYWDCPNLFDADECLPRLQATQLAPGVPYQHQWATYHRRSDAVQYRDLYQARGLRLLVTTHGRGARLDLQQCMLQLFVALALMPIASGLADTIMQNFLSERRHYREYKTENSPDFSDVRAKVEQLEKQSTAARHAKEMSYA
jgi:hypothetical protein